MSELARQRLQSAQLVRLRAVRMAAAARALTAARDATALAEAERRAADRAETEARQRAATAQRELVDDPQEAERRLAIVDHAGFRRAVAQSAHEEARAAEDACVAREAAERRAMIVARARHDMMEAQAHRLSRTAARRAEERAALESEDVRRFR